MKHEESKIQAEIVSALSLAGVYVFMIPNDAAGAISQAKAGRLRAMGLRAGISDLCLVGKDGHIYFLEVKTPEGVLSASQVRFASLCAARGWPYAVARSVDDAVATCKKWRLL